jgi:hypothetical protein
MARFDTLTSNISKFEDQSYSTEFDITPYLLSDDDAVKKLIAVKNPKLTKEQIDLIVDDEDVLIKKVEESVDEFPNESDDELDDVVMDSDLSKEQREIRKIERESRKRARQEKSEKRKREFEERKKEKVEEIRESKRIYKDKLKEFYEEIKRIKTSIKKAVFTLFKSSKELAKELILAIIKTSSSIPGITLIITSPPWNIALAISATVIIVQLYLKIIKDIKNVAPILEPIKYLPAITDKKNLSILSTIINLPMKIILGLWKPIRALDGVIKSLISAVKSSMKRNRNKIFRKATKKLRKLGHLRRIGPSLKIGDTVIRGIIGDPYVTDIGVVFSYDEDDVEEVSDLMSTFKINGSPNNIFTRVVDYRISFDQNLDSVQGELDEVVIDIPRTSDIEKDEFEDYIYDVKLPDGTVIKNISDDGIDYLKSKYTLQYANFVPDAT